MFYLELRRDRQCNVCIASVDPKLSICIAIEGDSDKFHDKINLAVVSEEKPINKGLFRKTGRVMFVWN
jgi:hypothetical protein